MTLNYLIIKIFWCHLSFVIFAIILSFDALCVILCKVLSDLTSLRGIVKWVTLPNGTDNKLRGIIECPIILQTLTKSCSYSIGFHQEVLSKRTTFYQHFYMVRALCR